MTFRALLPAVALLFGDPACNQARAQEILSLIPTPRQMRILTDAPVPAQAAEYPDIRLDGSETWDAEQYKLRVAPERGASHARTTATA